MSSAVYNRCGRSVGVYKIISENTKNVNEVLFLPYVRNDDFRFLSFERRTEKNFSRRL